MKTRFYPAALSVRGKRCVVIGADDEARTKARRLGDAGADVTLVDFETFKPDDLTDQFLVILSYKASDDLAHTVARRCREKRILLAALDRPALCDIIHLAVFDRGRLRVGISTEGASPGLARKIREGLESSLSAEPIEAFLDDLAALRERLEKDIPDFAERRRALLAAVEGFEFRASLTFPATWRPGDKRSS